MNPKARKPKRASRVEVTGWTRNYRDEVKQPERISDEARRAGEIRRRIEIIKEQRELAQEMRL